MSSNHFLNRPNLCSKEGSEISLEIFGAISITLKIGISAFDVKGEEIQIELENGLTSNRENSTNKYFISLQSESRRKLCLVL